MSRRSKFKQRTRCWLTGKISHITRQVAKKIGKKMKTEAYFCNGCRGWHTGHNKDRPQIDPRPLVKNMDEFGKIIFLPFDFY